MTATLMSESAFRRIAHVALSSTKADHALVNMGDSQSTTLRFANNQVVQHVSVREPRLTVEVAFGQKKGTARANRFDEESVQKTVAQAERIAKLAPDDREYMPPLPSQEYLSPPTFKGSTASTTPMDLARRTKPVIDRCKKEALTAAGIMTSEVSCRGIAASSGLCGYEQSTASEFSLTATATDSSGWTSVGHRDINELDIPENARRAIDKAVTSKSPKELPAGHYPVILEPAAVAGIMGPIFWYANAKSYYRGNSPFVGKLNTRILDERITLRSDPMHPDLMGSGFDREGLATKPMTWVDKGVLQQLYYDRFTAKEHNVAPTPFPSSGVMEVVDQRVQSVDDLVASTKRAILITNFWYIRPVDPKDMTMTGMTRDGTFLVEDGRIVCGVRNFRWHDSPLRCFAQIDAATVPMAAQSMERGKSMLPAVRLPDFYLSSVTEF
jgi:predicted Zn-dependent protease